MDVEDTVETYRLRLALSHDRRESVRAASAPSVRQIRAVRRPRRAWPIRTCSRPSRRRSAIASRPTRKICSIDDENLRFVFDNLTTKGLRGAVGTAASYERLLGSSPALGSRSRRTCLESFGLLAREISTQTYPRKLDYLLLSALAGLGASLSKFAADVRLLSSPGFGEIAEPFGEQAGRQLGDAVQAQSDSVRTHRFARALAARLCRRRVAERGDELSGTHARRQREPAHDPTRSAALRRRDRDARSHGDRGAARRRAAHRGESAHVRAVRRNGGRDDGSGARRRRPPASARSTAQCIDGSVGGGRAGRGQSALAHCSPRSAH